MDKENLFAWNDAIHKLFEMDKNTVDKEIEKFTSNRNCMNNLDEDFATTKLASSYIAKHNLIVALKESAFCVVEESKNDVDCTKNRYGYRNMDTCKDYKFEKVKLSELNGVVGEIQNKYYGKNVWLLLDQ